MKKKSFPLFCSIVIHIVLILIIAGIEKPVYTLTFNLKDLEILNQSQISSQYSKKSFKTTKAKKRAKSVRPKKLMGNFTKQAPTGTINEISEVDDDRGIDGEKKPINLKKNLTKDSGIQNHKIKSKRLGYRFDALPSQLDESLFEGKRTEANIKKTKKNSVLGQKNRGEFKWGNSQARTLIKKLPDPLVNRNLEGDVLISFKVNPAGIVTFTTVLKSSGISEIDRQFRDYIRDHKFNAIEGSNMSLGIYKFTFH